MPSDVKFDNVGGDEADIRQALRLGDRFKLNVEDSIDIDDDTSMSTYEVGIDADGVRKVFVIAEQIQCGDSFGFRINGDNTGRQSGYNNYYKAGTPDESMSEVILAKNMTADTPWTGIIEIHSRDVASFIARGAKPGLPEETLDYATWNGNVATPNINEIRFMGRNGSTFQMKRTQVLSVYTKVRDHEDPVAY